MASVRVIAVTGTPGTGKTVVGKLLAKKLDALFIDVNDLVKERAELIDGFDRDRDTRIIDIENLRKHIKQVIGNIDGDVVLTGHFSHKFPVTHVVVLRTSPLALYGRLNERGYGRGKVMENIEAELAGVCLGESVKVCSNIIELDTTSTRPEKNLDGIIEWLGAGGKRLMDVDWSSDFIKLLEEQEGVE